MEGGWLVQRCVLSQQDEASRRASGQAAGGININGKVERGGEVRARPGWHCTLASNRGTLYGAGSSPPLSLLRPLHLSRAPC